MKKLIRLPQLSCIVLLLSCTTDVQTADPVKTPTASLPAPVATLPAVTPAVDGVSRMYQAFAITGETSVTPKTDFVLPVPTQKADISALRTTGSTATLNYIAIGGSLTAGYRNQGLTRESQMTAYPNLIANQMGLVNFKTPLFETSEANGSGGVVFDGTADLPSWKQVTNQTAILNKAPMSLKKYNGGDFQNISAPFLAKDGFQSNYGESSQSLAANSFVERLFKDTDMIPANTGYSPFTPTLETVFKKQKADIYTVEFGFDGMINNIMTQRNVSFEGFMLGSYQASLDSKGKVIGKPVWLLMPSQFLRFPYFQFFTYDKLIKKLGVSEILIGTGNDTYTEKANKDCVFLPTKRILDAINNKTPLDIVPDVEVMDATECSGDWKSKEHIGYNKIIETVAKEKNIPLVDLQAVYDKVLNGQYISEDGFKIDPSFPKGNFFSQDGIYPSAIGQAVIANEVIKVMNKAYQTKIPLVNITEFARKLN